MEKVIDIFYTKGNMICVIIKIISIRSVKRKSYKKSGTFANLFR